MGKRIVLALILMILVSNPARAREMELSQDQITSYWSRLEAKADKLYGGFDLSVEVLTGLYEDNEYKGEIKLEIPIYSKEDQRQKQEDKIDFLDKGQS